jgi:hypothetical protein
VPAAAALMFLLFMQVGPRSRVEAEQLAAYDQFRHIGIGSLDLTAHQGAGPEHIGCRRLCWPARLLQAVGSTGGSTVSWQAVMSQSFEYCTCLCAKSVNEANVAHPVLLQLPGGQAVAQGKSVPGALVAAGNVCFTQKDYTAMFTARVIEPHRWL